MENIPDTQTPASQAPASQAASTPTPEAGEKTLRQSEVDRLIGERLLKERRRYENELAEQKTARERAESALSQREEALFAFEMRQKAAEALARRGLPASLLGALRLQSEQALDDSLASAESAFRKALEEGVRARLSGQTAPAAPESETPPVRMNYQQAAALYQADRAAYQKKFGGK